MANLHLVGPEDLAVRGEIRFEPGILACKRKAGNATGLSLPFDAGRMGRLALQTCLLPDREAPYILSVELARHRIKMFIAKSEEWQMFDLSDDHPATEAWESARQIFSRALIASDPVEAWELGCESLTLGIEATERLANAHAEILLHRRYGGRPASSSTLGVKIWPSRSSPKIQEIVQKEFDHIVIPLRWNQLEVEEGKYNWDPVDQWMQWAQTNGKPVLAGPLLDFSRGALPKWLYVWQHDYDTCRDLAYDHIERVVDRYKSAVSIWNVATGINVNDNFEFTAAQMMDLTRMVSLVVRQSRKGARTMVELAQPFGEFAARNRDSLAPLTFVDRLVQEGIRFDCLGVQVLLGESSAGHMCRDLMQISSMLDRLFLLEVPIVVSAGVPSRQADVDGGWWMNQWDSETQARWASRMFGIALSKPHVETINWNDLFDHDRSDLTEAGLINDAGHAKPALNKLIGLRRRLRKPLGPLNLKSKGKALR